MILPDSWKQEVGWMLRQVDRDRFKDQILTALQQHPFIEYHDLRRQVNRHVDEMNQKEFCDRMAEKARAALAPKPEPTPKFIPTPKHSSAIQSAIPGRTHLVPVKIQTITIAPSTSAPVETTPVEQVPAIQVATISTSQPALVESIPVQTVTAPLPNPESVSERTITEPIKFVEEQAKRRKKKNRRPVVKAGVFDITEPVEMTLVKK